MELIVPLELTENAVRQIKYEVWVDLNNDGTYETNITSDVLSIDYINVDLELKKRGSVLGKPSSSNASITIKNNDGKYSPNNQNSPIYGQFKRNTKILIKCGFIDSEGNPQLDDLFQGVCVNFNNKVVLNNRNIVVSLLDFAKFAKNKKNPNHSYGWDYYNSGPNSNKLYEAVLFNATISDAVKYLIEFAYGTEVSDSANIQVLNTNYPCIEFPIDENIWTTLQKLCESCDGRMYWEHGIFNFITPLSPSYVHNNTSVYTFNGTNIYELIENVDEDQIINKWKLTSNGKTLQPRTCVVGTPESNVQTVIEEYKNGDGKNALGVDNKTITLKYQEGTNWINTINIPLVDTTTYSDLGESPTQELIDNMNLNSIVKVYDKLTNTQLIIQDIIVGDHINPAKIILKDALNPTNYNINVTYQFFTDRIVFGKYRWYEYALDKITKNIGENYNINDITTYPDLILNAHNGKNQVTFSMSDPTNNLYLSDWSVLDGNKRIKFKLTNNVPIDDIYNIVYISKQEIYGNPLDCISPLIIEAIDATTLGEFENNEEIQNDYVVDSTFGKNVLDELLHRYKQNRSFLNVQVKGIPQIRLMDIVTINETTSGFNNSYKFYVTGYKHTPKSNEWKTTLQLESLAPAWTYDGSGITINNPHSVGGISVSLPTISITSNDAIENVFANNILSHSTMLHFSLPNIPNFLEARILYRQYKNGSWGSYNYLGSITDITITSFMVTDLATETQYKFYLVLYDRNGGQSDYGSGYQVTTPTLTELQTAYPILSVPTNIQITKSVNRKCNISCNESNTLHYKTTRFQMVKDGLAWNHESVVTQDSKSFGTSFTFPTEDVYKFRVAYVDIWDRVGSWSVDSQISGAKIDSTEINPQIFLLNTTSGVPPSGGDIKNIYDGNVTTYVDFNAATYIEMNYSYEQIFSTVRVNFQSNCNFYAKYFDEVDQTWKDCCGSDVSSKNGVAGKNIFQIDTGTLKQVKAKKMRLYIKSAARIYELRFGTVGQADDFYFEKMTGDQIEANSLKIGREVQALPTPLAINTTDHLWHFDSSLNSTRGIQPLAGAVATLRPGEGRFGGAVAVEQAATNLMQVGSQKFEGWLKFQGAEVILTQNQVVPEWGATDATRIQASGGTHVVKYVSTILTPSVNGQSYAESVYIKNIGTATIRIAMNIPFDTVGSREATINPGECKLVKLNGLGNGVLHLQMQFLSQNVSDSLDFIAWHPMVETGQIHTSYTETSRANGLLPYDAKQLNINTQYGAVSWWCTDPKDSGSRALLSIGDYASTRTQIHKSGDILRIWTNNGENTITKTWNGYAHFVFTWTPTKMQLYMDGELIITRNQGLVFGNLEYFAIGCRYSSGWGMQANALFDEIRLASGEVTADMVRTWYSLNAPFVDPQGILPDAQIASAQIWNETTTGTINYRSTGAPTNAPTPTACTVRNNPNGSINIELDWGAYVQGAKKADMLILFWREDGTAPTVNDNKLMFNVNTSAASSYIFQGLPAKNYAGSTILYSFGIAAARRTENGLEVGAIQAPTSSPDWRGVSGAGAIDAGNVPITAGNIEFSGTGQKNYAVGADSVERVVYEQDILGNQTYRDKNTGNTTFQITNRGEFKDKDGYTVIDVNGKFSGKLIANGICSGDLINGDDVNDINLGNVVIPSGKKWVCVAIPTQPLMLSGSDPAKTVKVIGIDSSYSNPDYAYFKVYACWPIFGYSEINSIGAGTYNNLICTIFHYTQTRYKYTDGSNSGNLTRRVGVYYEIREINA